MSEAPCQLVLPLLSRIATRLTLRTGHLRAGQNGRVLAKAVYDERSLPSGTLETDRLGILADALEDAGCTDATILEHLRGPGPHVRGCFVVDLMLGKT